MNRIAKWMLRMYPAAWRARYGDEVDALLADTGADAKTIADLLTGGIRMRFSTGAFLKLAAVLGVAGMLLGIGASYLVKARYTSKATLQITPAGAMMAEVLPTQLLQTEETKVWSRTILATIINDPRLNLYSDERIHTPLEDVIDDMKRDIRIEFVALPGRHAAAFTIVFSYTDKVKARQTVNALINAFMKHNLQLGRQGGVLEVLDAASMPVTPASPNRNRYAWFGLLSGLVLACVITVVRRRGHSPSATLLATNE